ncbi:hypothetical protein [Sphingomonas xanthus]|uniref:Uncharacterized protein n=1 Tax=Sphingomonas xanthus TaxID=2594473 RepID=A0A516IPL7_9SPHN|nr:hypothetical protein [Sphingomonas xanthus]QDP18827.1 hypothetical protein FMM02_01945 [Sphingomonas xanthus]
MTLLSFLVLIPALMTLSAETPTQEGVVRRVVIRDEVILKIPIRPRLTRPVEWRERKGPKCIDTQAIAGALLSGPSSIDFVMRDRRRFRAVMDNDCPALDYYGRFYFQLTDNRICAKREMIRSRVGGSCRIERFRALVPKPDL